MEEYLKYRIKKKESFKGGRLDVMVVQGIHIRRLWSDRLYDGECGEWEGMEGGVMWSKSKARKEGLLLMFSRIYGKA